jgi:hypothetical protein
MDSPLSDEELAKLEALTEAATPAPWESYVEEREPIGGSSSIQLGVDGTRHPTCTYHDDKIAPDADLDFIAAARHYMPRLLAEVRRLRGHS